VSAGGSLQRRAAWLDLDERQWGRATMRPLRHMTAIRPRVLVVDDDPSFLSIVEDVLSERGFDVISHSEPRRVLEQLPAGDLEVAVLDLVMPQMDGLELTRALRQRSPATQIVILTGQADLSSAVEGIHEGVFDYLQKSTLQLERLDRVVQRACERFRLLRDNQVLFARTQEANRLLQALHHINTELTAEHRTDRLLDLLVLHAKEVTGAQCARAVLFRRESGLLIETAAGDGGDAIRGARLHPGEGLAALALETDRPVVADRPKQHPRYSHRSDELPSGDSAFLALPLRHGAVHGALLVGGRSKGFEPEQAELLLSLARQAAVAIERAREHERSENFFTHVSELLVSVLDRLDLFYPGHSRAVAALADMVTRRLGMGDAERRNVHFGALLHDIGKIMVDPALLSAEDSLTAEQFRMLRRHPVLGMELLRPITVFEGILPIVHAHHEHFDGKGYPIGLAGEDIPLGARVVAVAESFDAMTRERPHGSRRTPEEALAELERCAGTQFDPRVVRLFVAEYKRHFLTEASS
jgi:putative nucleotidyltransferase with HDIG domain